MEQIIGIVLVILVLAGLGGYFLFRKPKKKTAYSGQENKCVPTPNGIYSKSDCLGKCS